MKYNTYYDDCSDVEENVNEVIANIKNENEINDIVSKKNDDSIREIFLFHYVSPTSISYNIPFHFQYRTYLNSTHHTLLFHTSPCRRRNDTFLLILILLFFTS